MFIPKNIEFFIENIGLPQNVIIITSFNSGSYERQYVLVFTNYREISIGKLYSEPNTWELTVTFDDKIEDETIRLSAHDLYQVLPNKIQEIARR